MSGAGRGQDHSQVSRRQGNGLRVFMAARFMKGIGMDGPQEPTRRMSDPMFCQGEVLLWQSSEYPSGTNMVDGKRGSLVGAIPEALCGEAPKGQPMIRRENLEVVCVEAPEGQPRNHRHHPNKPRATSPTRERERKDPRQ